MDKKHTAKISRAAALILSLSVTAVILSGCDLFVKKSTDEVDLYWYMGLTTEDSEGNDNVIEVENGTIAAVAVESGYAEDYGLVVDGRAYVSIDTAASYIDSRFFLDSDNEEILFTGAAGTYTISYGSNFASAPGGDINYDYDIALYEGDTLYIELDVLYDFHELSYIITEETEDNPAIISIRSSNDTYTYMTASGSVVMRTKGNYLNMVVTKISKGTKLLVLDSDDDSDETTDDAEETSSASKWTKVETEDGYVGYVPADSLKNASEESADFTTDDEEYTHTLMDGKVCLGWHAIYSQSGNDSYADLTENASALNVISPTWFTLSDKKGNLYTFADYSYVESAHEDSLMVWALVSDITTESYTEDVLTNTESRLHLVESIMFYLNGYDLDGINVDFEYITEDTAAAYLQFLRELSVECRSAGKILSIDNYKPSDSTSYYGLSEQARLADYIIFMNYDEHNSTSSSSGSVSSMSFMEESIQDAVSIIGDSTRIINGIPFYTRVWEETPESSATDEQKEGIYVEDAANGNYYISVYSIGMTGAESLYESAGAEPSYDESTGQNYVGYEDGDTLVRIWLEDKTSLAARMEFMSEYDLGGSAFWALGFEKASVWKTIAKYYE